MPTTNNATATISRYAIGLLVSAFISAVRCCGSWSIVSMYVTTEAKAIIAPTIAEVTAVRMMASGRSASLSLRVMKSPMISA